MMYLIEPTANTFYSWDIWLAKQDSLAAEDIWRALEKKRLKIAPMKWVQKAVYQMEDLHGR